MEHVAPIVALRPPSRASHPTADAVGGDGDVEDAESAGHLSFHTLRAIVTGLARAQTPLTTPLACDGPTARSERLIGTTFYDVWLITWPDGSGMASHDHGGSRSVMQVVDGELVEVLSEPVAQAAVQRRVLRTGDVVSGAPTVIHELTNRS